MRAVVAPQYGGPEVLDVVDRDTPIMGPDTVLVRTRAASINPVDWKIIRGYLAERFPTTLPLVPGWDVAGEVEAIGPAVTAVAVGDRVMGYARKDWIGEGTWAEQVAVPERGVAAMPTSVGFAEASCLPLAGLTAYQALVDKLAVGQDDTVLIHAASGGVGTLAVQIARALGVRRVIGTASEGSFDHLRGIGAEPVAYGDGLEARLREAAPDGVDAVLDLVGGAALELSPGLLTAPERLCSVVDAARVLELGGHYVFVRPDADQLGELARMVDAGEVTVRINERFGLHDVRAAVERAQAGSVRGKVVLEV
jgi:NADPH:quinone reductase-like Zn-dependent oxidoreductase